MESERIDLSPLDPKQDRRRWNALVESVAAKGMRIRARRLSIGYQLSAWARPALALAGATACLAVLGATLLGRGTSTSVATEADPVWVMSSWASQNQTPSTDAILSMLGRQP